MQELVDSVKAGRCLSEEGEGMSETEPVFKDFTSSDLFRLQQFGNQEHESFLKTIEDLKNWELLQHKHCVDNQITVHYKLGDNGKLTTLLQMELPYEAHEIAAVFYETDLFHVWLKADPGVIKHLHVLETDFPSLSALFLQIPLKWPLHDRWMTM